MERTSGKRSHTVQQVAESGSKKVAAVWWCLIIASVALIITSPWHAWAPVDTTAADGERIKLAVMEMQGRFLIGASQTQPVGLEEQLAEIEIWATTDQTAVAVAAIRFFIDPQGNGKWRALAVINARLKEPEDDKSNRQLLENVKMVLTESDQLKDGEREQIRKQMGWFGDILLTANAAENSPEEKEAEAIKVKAVATVVIVGFLALATMGIGLLGIGMLTIGLLMLKNQKLYLAGVNIEIPAQPYLGAFALYLMTMVIADFLSVVVHPLISIVGMFVSIGIAFLWPRMRGLGWRESLRGFGWCRGKGIAREMGAGIIGYVAMTPVFALGLASTLILIFISGWLAKNGSNLGETVQAAEPVSHPVVAWIADGDWKVNLAVIFLASGLAPLFEETMFRGALYQALRSRWNFVISGFISGVIFAAVHPQGLLAIPALTAMGFGFAIIREWRGTLIASMTAHAVHNGILICTLILVLS